MRRRGWPVGLASACALALVSQAAYVVGVRADDRAPATPAIVEPELPPDIDKTPPVVARSPIDTKGVVEKPLPAKASKKEPREDAATTEAVAASPATTKPASSEVEKSATMRSSPASSTEASKNESPIAAAASSLSDGARGDTPPPSPASAGETAETDAADAPPKTDPEAAVADGALPGATPTDIAATIAALPPADLKKSPVVGLRNWGSTRDGIERFYLARGNMPIFTETKGLSALGKTVVARLNRAGEDGLDLSGVAIPGANETTETPKRLAELEVEIAEAVAVYAFQASGGRIDPRNISSLITTRADVADTGKTLEAVATARDPDAALVDLNPPQKGYRELRERLAKLRAVYPQTASTERAPELRPHAASSEQGAALIRPRFDRADTAEPTRGAQLAAADAAHSNDAVARLDPSMEQALAGRSPRALEAAILANMEMWRWEPRDMGEERIEVNVADFTLRVLRGDESVHTARIIVGKPDTPTPIFSNAMKYILVNPSWSVPASIVRKEMLPKLAKDPDYLTRMGFEVTQHGDSISVKQPPGERNALGHLAFMFPNEHSVYLHDTPSRGLFTASRRAFSHGCVRVDQPIRLAEVVMGDGWSEQKVRSMIGGSERTVFLPHPLPIHIEYFTAFVDDAGDLQMREDLYGHMRRVESALGLAS